jgi:dTDP-4-dehydrorhamnose reductase
MRVLIVGSQGQLGQELQRTAPAGVELLVAGRAELDISQRQSVLDYVQAFTPQVIINAAAYTAVDGAETKPDWAVQVNAEGAGYLARAAQQIGARLLHVSTDFVFDGTASAPYSRAQEPRPLGVYGHSKLAGERRVLEVLPLQSIVLRTAWVYSAHGANFVQTMLRLMNERTELGVVSDQIGTPTWAKGLAQTLWGFAQLEDAHGIYHWTDAGSCSWYDFACAICDQGRSLGLVNNDELRIAAIATSEYPTPAQRPAYSVLDCSETTALLGCTQLDWQTQLQQMLEELKSL